MDLVTHAQKPTLISHFVITPELMPPPPSDDFWECTMAGCDMSKLSSIVRGCRVFGKSSDLSDVSCRIRVIESVATRRAATNRFERRDEGEIIINSTLTFT